MQELERQHYLTFMGIQSWMPRQALPFALATPEIPWCDVNLATQDQGLSGNSQLESPAHVQESVPPGLVKEDVLSEVANTPKQAPHLAASSDKTEALKTEPKAITVAPNTWSFFYVKAGVYILCFETAGDPAECKLARAIVDAVLPGQGQSLTLLRWPLVESSSVDADAGKTMLNVFMRELMIEAEQLLLFGALNQGLFQPLLGEHWAPDSISMQNLPTLQAMLHDVSHKRAAWNQLKSLFFPT